MELDVWVTRTTPRPCHAGSATGAAVRGRGGHRRHELNTGSADFTISGDQVTFASLVLTELAYDPLADMVEEAIVDTLDGTTT